jgi:hypothetical protein
MTIEQVSAAILVWLIIVAVVYTHSGWRNIKDCYSMWFDRSYWTDYNIIEALSWVTKAVIIVPGLIFGIQIWQLYFVALFTSATLIWASNKKLLPTLVGFNTLWIWLSLMVIMQNLI